MNENILINYSGVCLCVCLCLCTYMDYTNDYIYLCLLEFTICSPISDGIAFLLSFPSNS